MKKRNWRVEERLAMVLEGFKEKRSVAEICQKHQISQTLYITAGVINSYKPAKRG